MSKSIYVKLAFTNIKNNRRTYVPYLLTTVLTVMMFYMMTALAENNSIEDPSLKTCLALAVRVIAIFAVIFLFYTNSFLVKRRKKELGVYNILGMEKRHIAKMLSVETIITTAASLIVGIVGGIIFSKLMYLVLLKIIHYDIHMEFQVSFAYVWPTALLFGGIFLLTLLHNLVQVKLANPVELLRGGRQGEKEPKTKWLLTIFGLLALGSAYYIAQTVEAPLDALSTFFIAVVCVILGTFALFTAGSIALLKALRRNKIYYYKTQHFTAVSGMIYRMKQNAAGLANICILSTMILVMVSTSISLYVGMEDVLNTRFPKEYEVVNYMTNDEQIKKINEIIEEEIKQADVKPVDMFQYRRGTTMALKKGAEFSFDQKAGYGAHGVYELYVMPLEDYNKMEGKHVDLNEDEVLVYPTGDKYGKDEIRFGSHAYRVAEELDSMKVEKKNSSRVVQAYYIVVRDTETIYGLLEEAYAKNMLPPDLPPSWLERNSNIEYCKAFDLKGEEENCISAMKAITNRVNEEIGDSSCAGRELSRSSFFELYGGLLFIGIYLGFMFLMATVLIIYYKQISEGFDDRERYQIMQKVGMSKREVKQSIRSQILTVFFLPLIAAIIHIAFAFKVITRLLAVLNLVNVPLFLTCTIITVVVFAIFYAIIFAITAREYYKIVN